MSIEQDEITTNAVGRQRWHGSFGRAERKPGVNPHAQGGGALQPRLDPGPGRPASSLRRALRPPARDSRSGEPRRPMNPTDHGHEHRRRQPVQRRPAEPLRLLPLAKASRQACRSETNKPLSSWLVNPFQERPVVEDLYQRCPTAGLHFLGQGARVRQGTASRTVPGTRRTSLPKITRGSNASTNSRNAEAGWPTIPRHRPRRLVLDHCDTLAGLVVMF